MVPSYFIISTRFLFVSDTLFSLILYLLILYSLQSFFLAFFLSFGSSKNFFRILSLARVNQLLFLRAIFCCSDFLLNFFIFLLFLYFSFVPYRSCSNLFVLFIILFLCKIFASLGFFSFFLYLV